MKLDEILECLIEEIDSKGKDVDIKWIRNNLDNVLDMVLDFKDKIEEIKSKAEERRLEAEQNA